jgi:hypothetical protein
MMNQLKKLVQTEELIEFYLNVNDLSKFGVGKVLKVSDEWVVLATISPSGMYDGFGLIKFEDILRLNLNTKHLSKISKLYTAKKQNHIYYDVKDENLLLGFLEFAQKNNFIVSIQFLDNEYFDGVGYIKKMEKDLLVISNISKYGEFDGESHFKLQDITRISCDDEEEHCLKILSSDTSK